MFAAALVLCGCASPAEQPMADQPMKMMRAMREKMREAKTPQEREAVMEEHMKAMAMMCGMGAQDDGGMTLPPIK
jgi:hypothetical protein